MLYFPHLPKHVPLGLDPLHNLLPHFLLHRSPHHELIQLLMYHIIRVIFRRHVLLNNIRHTIFKTLLYKVVIKYEVWCVG